MEDIVRVVELKRIKARVFILGLGSVVWVSRRITYILNELYYFLNDGSELRKPEKARCEE